MKAILISGLEKKTNKQVQYFAKDCKRLRRYLLKKVGLKQKDISFFSPKRILNIKLKGLLSKVGKIVSKNSSEPLLVYYSGHGLSKMWSLYEINDRRVKSYSLCFTRLMKVLKNHNAPLIVVADTCFAMSLKRHMEELRCQWMLIGLAPEGQYGDEAGVLGQVIESWLKRRPADPKYNTGKRLVRFFKVKKYNQTKYCLLYGSDKRFHKFFPIYSFKRIEAVLREGSSLDYFVYPKK
ncbi:MAG: caspase family protein [bacterium]|nr:caspase family protein [bacterium]